jgi:hypothetical protein
VSWDVEVTDEFATWYVGLTERQPPPGGNLRVLFAFDSRRTAILLIGGDKSGRWNAWYSEAVPVAEQLHDAYLAELRSEGLIDTERKSR